MATITKELKAQVYHAILALVPDDSFPDDGYAELPVDIRLEQHLKENITDASQRAIRAAVNALKDEKKLVPVRGRNPSLVKLPQRDLPFAQVAEASAAAAAKEQQASSQTRLDVASESFLNEVISAVAVLAEYPDKLKALLRLDSQLLADNEALQRENEVLKAENEELRPYKGLYETLAAVFEGQRNSET